MELREENNSRRIEASKLRENITIKKLEDYDFKS